MLAELTRDDWRQVFGLKDANEIPDALILRGTRQLKMRLAQYAALLDGARELVSTNGIFDDIILGGYKEKSIAVASIYGAPMASEVVHAFSVMGVKRIILTGCCGSLAEEFLAGDIIVPQAAFPSEGASQYYGAAENVLIPADGELFSQAVKMLQCSSWSIHTGSIYTTCALCAETSEDINTWRQAGHLAVDMETATVYAVARHFNVPAVALLFAFDCLAAGEHMVLTDSAKAQRRAEGEALMMKTAFELACQADVTKL